MFREAAIRQVIAAYHPVGLSLICCWWQTIANLRSASATPLVTQACICVAFSFGFRLSALRNTHDPSELHGKRMAERLPLQCSGTLSDGTLCHLPAVMPHRFFRREFRLYRLRIAQPFSKCRHTWRGQLGIEPTAHGFGDRVATLEHLPTYFHSKPDVTPAPPFVSICALTFQRRTSRPLLWSLPSKEPRPCAITDVTLVTPAAKFVQMAPLCHIGKMCAGICAVSSCPHRT